jgi:hypothetical protein
VGCPIFKWAQWHLAWENPYNIELKIQISVLFEKVLENKPN